MSKCFFWVADRCQYQNMLKKLTKTCPFLQGEECTAESKEDFAQVLKKYQWEISQ